MKWINGYLSFDGNCKEAMEFYRDALGGDLQMMPYGEHGGGTPEAAARTMHARLEGGGALLMASDVPPGRPVTAGNNFSLAIENESAAEQDELFSALGQGGTVTMPLADQFWGARFGMLTDRFGVNWMFNLDAPKADAA